jgi:glycine/D-amino acid oxidase-like deaminating enzyme
VISRSADAAIQKRSPIATVRTVKQASPPNSHPLWRDGIAPIAFPTLQSDYSCDIAIVGGGFSGLWSAYHLLSHQPSLRIAVFESREIGFGASGRNGGWISADYPVDTKSLKRRYPKKDVDGFTQLLRRGVDEVGAISSAISPGASFRKSGALLFATNNLQLDRLKDSADFHHHLLSRDEVQAQIKIPSAIGGLFTSNCATVNPRRLLMDLAEHLSRQGVTIFETSHARHPSRFLSVNRYRVDAKWVILASEAFGEPSRERIPLYSLMVATRTLKDSERDAIGWSPGLAIAEATNNVNYAQLTSDFRIALGGRGAGYPFASRLDPRLEANTETHRSLRELIHTWFETLDDVEITHHWGGPISIRRNWESLIRVDRHRGVAELGGYVGDGMTMSFIAARAVAERIMKGSDPLENMPIDSGERPTRRWPIEPLRYIGARAMLGAIQRADIQEKRGRKPILISRFLRWIGK